VSGDHFINLQPGTIVNGRYEIVKCLGTGSMGMVYACRHRELAGHIVAMKVLFAEVARDEVAAARFRNEIVASYEVSHPNVVRAYEYFRDGDLIAFTMEYIGGGDLADRISGDEFIPIPETIGMLKQMCSGVQAIHDKGIIHRDLKPENILITAQGQIKITDFGIARTGTGPKLTEHGGVVGTIDYVSPEYLERGQVDARSDIYALGVLAYEMLTGEAPYRGKSVIETMTLRLRSDPEPPHHLRAECPIGLSNVILKAMRRDPELRYQSADEMLDDLKALQAGSAKTAGVGNKQGAGRGSFTEKIDSLADPMRGSMSSAESSAGYGGGVGADHYAVAQDSPGGTLELGSNAVHRFRESKIDELDDFPHFEPMAEPMVRSGLAGSVTSGMGGGRDVSVTASSLSTERIKELSYGVEVESQYSSLKVVVTWVAVFLVGFGVGLLVLQSVQPEFFAGDEAATTERLE
jgi:serine/threonine protein kinase